MRKYILLFSSIFLIMGCASTSKIQIVEKPKTRREIIYDTHPVNVSLETNQELLIKLNNKLITFAKYDSILTGLGCSPTETNFIEDFKCNTTNAKNYEEVIRADYFFHADSLIDIVYDQMEALTISEPTYIMPYFYLASINYRKENNIESIITYLDKAQAFSNSVNRSRLSLMKASLYNSNENYLNASNEYENAFNESNKYLGEFWHLFFGTLINTNQINKADSLYNKLNLVSEESDFDNKYFEQILNLHWAKGEFEKANSLCKSTSSKYVEEDIVYILIMLNEFHEARQQIINICDIDLDYLTKPNIYIFAPSHLMIKHQVEAINRLTNTTELFPNNKDAQFCNGFLLAYKELKKNTEEQNKEMINKALISLKKSQTNDPEIQYFIGYFYEKIGNFSEALKYFSNVEQNSKYYPYSLINQALIFEEKNPDKYISNLLEAQQILNDNPDLIDTIGYHYYIIKDYKNSIIWFNKLLNLKPNSNLTAIWLSDSYLKLNEFETALFIINQTIERILTDDDKWFSSSAYVKRGDIYKAKSEWEQAILSYEKSIKINPDLFDVQLDLAQIYYKLDDWESAESTLLSIIESIEMKGNIQNYRKNYTDALFDLNIHYMIYNINPTKRVEIFEQATNYFPSSAWCFRLLGAAWLDCKDYRKSKEALNKSIKLDSNYYFTYSLLAEAYENEGNYSKAILNYNNTINALENDNLKLKNVDQETYQNNLESIEDCFIKIANIHIENENYDLAILELEKAISITSNSNKKSYRFQLADVYYKKNDYVKAIKIWKLVYKETKGYGAKYNIALSYYNIGGLENLKKSKKCFFELKNMIIDDMNESELLNQTNEWLDIINSQIEYIEWPILIDKLVESKNPLISNIAKVYKITEPFRDINNLWVDGSNETTPVYSGDGDYIKSYNVSSKIFQSENLCDRLKTKLSSIQTQNGKLKEIISLWTSSLETRKEGIILNSQGYYIKAKDYTGEFERGRAKIDIANQYYADGLRILKSLMQLNVKHFSKYGVESLDYLIEYYEITE
jgi:tetratricopeptide (TPR) repeat protein